MADRKAFNFYKSYWEQMKLLNDKQRVQILDAICKVQFLEINIDDISFSDKMAALVWAGVKHSVSTSLNGFVSKNKGLGEGVKIPLSKGLAKGGAQQGQEEEQVQGKGEEKGEGKKIKPYRSFAHLSLSIEENENLLKLGYSKTDIDSILDKIENYKKNNTYKSLFLTSKTWLKKEKSSPSGNFTQKQDIKNAGKFDPDEKY